MVSDCCNGVVFIINSFENQILCRYLRILYISSLIFSDLVIASIALLTYLLNKIVYVFQIIGFLKFFNVLSYLLNVDFIDTNAILYINFYNYFVIKESHLTNGMTGIHQCVKQENKFTLFHSNFGFSKNAVRNFNFILG